MRQFLIYIYRYNFTFFVVAFGNYDNNLTLFVSKIPAAQEEVKFCWQSRVNYFMKFPCFSTLARERNTRISLPVISGVLHLRVLRFTLLLHYFRRHQDGTEATVSRAGNLAYLSFQERHTITFVHFNLFCSRCARLFCI